MSLGNRQGAWGRQAPQSQQLNPNLFTGQLNLAQPFAAQQIGLVPGVNTLVNQAAFNNVNNAAILAAQRQQIPQRQPSPPQNSGQRAPNQRTFLGYVTKLMDNYGFIDEDVFFQTSVIRGGQMPRVGDRVMVDATFNPSMPFKWNALRIQTINDVNQPSQQQQPVRQSANQQSSNRWGDRMERDSRDVRVPRGASYDRNRLQRRPSPRRDDRRSPVMRRSPPRRSSPPPRRQSPVRREMSKRERERSPIVRESRESRRSPMPIKRDADSPPRRRQRIIPRYQCYVPRPIAPDFLNYIDLHKRYTSLYVPSDFVRCEFSWKNAFHLEDPIEFCPNPVEFYVLHKDVDYPFTETDPLPVETPEDADSRYMVKVLLLAHPGAIEIRKKMTGLLPDGVIDESLDVQSLFKILHFVIGIRGKGEVMGIGGAYSPSLDGDNPLDPQTLIKTAIRTTRAMTGVNLSNCSKWYKMLHLRYFRMERERWDHVVLLMPDTGSIPNFSPTADDYQKLVQEILPEQLKQKISLIDAEPFIPQSEAAKKVQAAIESKANEPVSTDEATAKVEAMSETAEMPADVSMENADSSTVNDTADSLNQSSEQVANNPEANGSAEFKKIPWSQLNVKSLKVAELREQLEARGLDSKGVKNILAQRLQEAVDAEKTSEEESENVEENVELESKPTEDVILIDETPAEEINPDDLVVKDEVDEKMDTSCLSDKKTADEKLVEQPKVEEKPAYTKEEKEEHKKEVDRFEKSKKERKSALERHFQFPKEPCAFVYPNKTAKSGKFDCKSVSVQSLLDYRLDDNKEASFETFLFAEAFHEAIDRDFAFHIYKTLNNVLDKESERKRRDETLTKVDAPVEAEETSATSDGAKAAENGVDQDGEQKVKIEEEKVEEDVSMEEKSSEEKLEGKQPVEEKKDEKKKEKGEKEEKGDPRLNFKALVNDVDTFTAFSHFDQNICGYLNDRDIEEILHLIGLNISRAAVQRLIRKVSSRDRFNYRNVTDKWVDKDFNMKYCPEPLPDSLTRAQLLKASEDEFGLSVPAAAPTTGATPDVTQTGVVFYKGLVLNVAQAQEQSNMLKNEKAVALLKVQELESVLKTTKDQRDYSDKKLQETLENVAQNKKRLQDAMDFAVASKKKLQEATEIIASQLNDSTSV